jgi:hypothetical protein
MAGAAAVIVLAFLLFFLTGRDDADPGPPPAAGGGPMTVETIMTESPTLNPARTINRAKVLVDMSDKRDEEMKAISEGQ